MAPRTRRAIVVGGSMAGLFAALMLRRIGWDVLVVEKIPGTFVGRGAGITTHPQLHDALAEVGLTAGDELGVPVPGRAGFDRDGRRIATWDYPQIMTSWELFHGILRRAWPDDRYRAGVTFTGVERTADGIRARFGDGTTEDADLLIGADGIRSTVRGLVMPDAQPTYVGYVGWRGLVDEKDISPATHAAIFPTYSFCHPPGEQMLTYPVAGAGESRAPGSRRLNFVWYRGADDATLRDLSTDAEGRHHALGIPPPLVRAAHVAALRRTARETLAPPFVEVIETAAQPFFQPIYDLTVPTMVAGRVAIVGDAAFIVRPHVGGGIAKAARDAQSLARILAAIEDVDAALAAFDAERMDENMRMVRHGQAMGRAIRAGIEPDRDDDRSVLSAIRLNGSLDFLTEGSSAA